MDTQWDKHMVTPSSQMVWNKLSRKIGVEIYGYELHQVNGQRKFFNPAIKSQFQPQEGSEVFVGRLPRDLFEDELVPPFLQIGEIYELRLMMNFSGTNRGFGFVMFQNPETARRAVKELNNYEIRRGHHIGVLTSVNNRRLYIGGLAAAPHLHSSLMMSLRELTDGVDSLSIHPMKKHKGRHATGVKYALVVYSTHRAAAMARRLLIPLKDDLFGSEVTIDWACPTMEAKTVEANISNHYNSLSKYESHAVVPVRQALPLPAQHFNQGAMPQQENRSGVPWKNLTGINWVGDFHTGDSVVPWKALMGGT